MFANYTGDDSCTPDALRKCVVVLPALSRAEQAGIALADSVTAPEPIELDVLSQVAAQVAADNACERLADENRTLAQTKTVARYAHVHVCHLLDMQKAVNSLRLPATPGDKERLAEEILKVSKRAATLANEVVACEASTKRQREEASQAITNALNLYKSKMQRTD